MPYAQLPAGSNPRKLTAKQLAFCQEYLTGEHTGKPMNALAAAKQAGYYIKDHKEPWWAASKLMRHPRVRAYIDEHLNAVSLSAAEVLFRFSEIARSEIGDVVGMDPTGRFLQIDVTKVIENKRFIKNFGYDSNGNPKIEFHDAHAALRDIARARGMNKEGLELTGAGGGPVVLQVQFVMPGQPIPVPDPNNLPLLAPAEDEDEDLDPDIDIE